MNNQLNIIGALAMDLRRASLGSNKISAVFMGEALDKRDKVNKNDTPLYIQNILNGIKKSEDKENLLMYSILLQNYSIYKYGKQK